MLWPPLVLFLVGFAMRLWFLLATADGGTCWHIGFQGDAPIWQDFAGLFAHPEALGAPDLEQVLPWRPPAMTYGVAWLWNGEGATAWPLRLAFVTCGALTPALTWLLLLRPFGRAVAWLAAACCAVASNLLLMASGLHAEAPYLLLVVISMFDYQRLCEHGARGRSWAALRWGVINGGLCLLRAEHLVAVVLLVLLAVGRAAGWRVVTIAIVATAAPLVPWQLHANAQVAAFNAKVPPLPAPRLPWTEGALARLRRLPGFVQPRMLRFVDATMRWRGADRVDDADLDVIHDAFGVEPAPLRPALIALQGALDFWQANAPEAADGFSLAARDRPPPLAGGREHYPPGELAGFPRDGSFSLDYPPHLHAFVHGYRLGAEELLTDPVAGAGRIAGKLWHALAGAVGGIGGYALPIGLSGERRPVDMVAATGWWSQCWRALVLVVAAVGCWRARRVSLLGSWLAFAMARLLVVAAFFGHARFGALCLPLVAVGVAVVVRDLAAARSSARLAIRLGVALFATVVVLEAIRWTVGAAAIIDGRPWIRYDGGSADHRPHRIEFR